MLEEARWLLENLGVPGRELFSVEYLISDGGYVGTMKKASSISEVIDEIFDENIKPIGRILIQPKDESMPFYLLNSQRIK